MTSLLKRTGAVLISGLFAITAFSGCQKQEETAALADIKVETAVAEYGTLEISTDYIGTLSPNLTVDVMPLMAGTVEKVAVEVGDRVKSGDLLAQLDDTSADLSVRSAEDAVDSAKAGKDAAGSQARSAKMQADANVKTMKTTLKGYEDSLKEAEKQLKKLKDSKSSIKSAQKQAQKSYIDTKKRYKTAQALQIQFQAFLDANPDCRTTAGLTAAATAVPVTFPSTEAPGAGGSQNNSNGAGITDNSGVQIPDSNQMPDSSQFPDSNQVPDSSQFPDFSQNTDNTGNQAGTGESSSQTDAAARLAKQKQAQALMKALTGAGITVEYLTDNGVNALKEDVADGETAYNGASSGLTQLETSITTLETNIKQLKGQIKATKESLKTAQEMADAASVDMSVYDAQIAAAKTGVDAAKYQKDLYRLTAPIDGVVDAVNIKENGMAAQGYAAFTISEKDSMVADFYVTEDVKNFLKLGDKVSLLKRDDEEKVENLGHITLINPTADLQKGLFKVEAEIVTTGQSQYSNGSTVKLSIVSNAVSGQILIPYDSVYYDDGQAYVYKVVNNQALRTDIETGLFNQEYITVTAGLVPGDNIITTWASGLKDGAEVTLMNGTIDSSEEYDEVTK